MLITSRPTDPSGEHIVLVATDVTTAERIHDRVASAYPRAQVTTRVGKDTGVVSAPDGAAGKIESLLVSTIEALLGPPTPGDEFDQLSETDLRLLVAELDTESLRAVIAHVWENAE